ncbi:SDR family oxidoreductase [Bacillus sp. FJAT-27251]|uniref:SDR family oxidoreductase n=1 Tax=Bacillus sp. FJAT-27251 TaxID=1684142 RepID=UPI0006A7B447|nr:SDR family oxidoreductase [Bacillus sp. FJAT-27251]
MGSKTALITGGAAGIGRKIAEQFASEGINLAINYRSSQTRAEALAKELSGKYGTQNVAIQADVSVYQQCCMLIEKAGACLPSIDILVHNAGPYIHERKRMADYSIEEWEYMINGNLNSGFYLSRLLIPSMRSRSWGRIITIGFDRVESAPGWIYRSAFAASKSGLASLTRTIAVEEAQHGITANMVCPGDIVGNWKERDIAETLGVQDGTVPVGRPGTGEDISRVVSFLAAEESAYITGSIIPVTGGKDVLGKVFREGK